MEEEGLMEILQRNFSIVENFNKIMKFDQSKGELACLHGIRVLSCLWIILTHCFILFTFLPATALANPTERLNLTQNWWMVPFYNLTMPMENFFLLSGCLAAFVFLCKRHGSQSSLCKMAILHVLHRFCRLTPMLSVTMLLYIWVSPHLMPSDKVLFDRDTCNTNWWTTLFYVGNLMDVKKMCMTWTWSLACDFQFHCLALLVLLPWALGKRNVGVFLCVIAVIINITIVIVLNKRDVSMLMSGSEATEEYSNQVYLPPWTRVGPFAIGLLLGWALNRHSVTRCNVTKTSAFLGCMLSILVAITSLYVIHFNIKQLHITGHYTWSDRAASVYEALARNLWACAVAWIIFACCTGKGGFVNTFLSWRGWLPLSRLSYGVYLVNQMVFHLIVFNLSKPFYMTPWNLILLFVMMTVVCFPLSLVLCLLVEYPAQSILSLLLQKLSGAKTADLSRRKKD